MLEELVVTRGRDIECLTDEESGRCSAVNRFATLIGHFRGEFGSWDSERKGKVSLGRCARVQ